MGVCQIGKALLQESFRGWKSQMNAKMTSFLKNYSKNTFGLLNLAWKAALGKGFQSLLLQQRLLRAVSKVKIRRNDIQGLSLRLFLSQAF